MSMIVFLLICVFAISSWIDINGVWVEIPLLVNVLPEGWNLPSYIVILIQIANVGPLAVTIAKRAAPTRVADWYLVYLIIGIGIASCALLAGLWDRTAVVGGQEHSVALLVLMMFLSLVDCTSSVVYLTYMAFLPAQYLTAFYIGEGLSGLIPAIIGLIQGLGKDAICVNTTVTTGNETSYEMFPEYDPPLFSVEVFFVILTALLCLSAIAFSFLHFHPYCRRYHLTTGEITVYDNDAASTATEDGVHTAEQQVSSSQTKLYAAKTTSNSKTAPPTTIPAEFSLTSGRVLALLGIVGWINALTNGVLPSLQSYSCLPYGNLAYNLTVKLSVLANPLACFFGLFLQVRSVTGNAVLAVIGTILAGYQIALAALSPNPPLDDEVIGIVLVIATYVILTAVFSYVKLCAASILSRSGGATGLLWCGAVTQLGSLIGAVITFVLVNVLELFESKYACT